MLETHFLWTSPWDLWGHVHKCVSHGGPLGTGVSAGPSPLGVLVQAGSQLARVPLLPVWIQREQPPFSNRHLSPAAALLDPTAAPGVVASVYHAMSADTLNYGKVQSGERRCPSAWAWVVRSPWVTERWESQGWAGQAWGSTTRWLPSESRGFRKGCHKVIVLPEELLSCLLFSLSWSSKFFTLSSSFTLSDSRDWTTECKDFAEAFSPLSTVTWNTAVQLRLRVRTKRGS